MPTPCVVPLVVLQFTFFVAFAYLATGLAAFAIAGRVLARKLHDASPQLSERTVTLRLAGVQS